MPRRPLTWSYGYYLENVREGLRAPGSWYHDRGENRIYYHLKDGERPEDLEAAYPVLRQLIEVKPGAGKTVRGLRFEGITFSGTDGHPGGSCLVGFTQRFLDDAGQALPDSCL